MKIVKVLVTLVLAVLAAIVVGFMLFVSGYIGPGNAAEEAIDLTAAEIARDVDNSLAHASPGDFSTDGIASLKSAVEDERGVILGSDSSYSIELNELQGWVDARFSNTGTGGLMGKTEESATVCLRFELRWTYARFVTYDEIDCP